MNTPRMAAKQVPVPAQEVITISDITNQILSMSQSHYSWLAVVPQQEETSELWLTMLLSYFTANAEVLFPREHDLKVVTGSAPSGLSHYTSLMASDPKSASVHKVRKPGRADQQDAVTNV